MNWTERFRKSDYKNNYRSVAPIIPRCKNCGLRIRGENHENGENCIARSKKK